ncbi:MAG TPA: AgmX/PglI C-terminal domain-containing protein [Polyangiaceae bacterium]|nr:AgmX/PglI C-terminal domain-containing protein [Polyangiaceae bacterium]
MRLLPLALFASAWLFGVAGAAAPSAPRGGHPEPRVVVDVLNVSGPHKRAELEAESRRSLWGKIVGCYRPAAQKKPGLKGDATLKLRVGAGGNVGAVRPEGSTFGDDELVACFQRHVAALAMPKAAADSDVTLQIHVAPGDPPGTTRPRAP